MRADLAFGERILETANNDATDWSYNPETGKLSIQKEAILRSKVKIETMRFHMERRHPHTWGERQQIDVNDMTQLTVEERMRKAAELLDLVQAITGPRPRPPPLEYRPEEPEDEEPTGGIGRS